MADQFNSNSNLIESLNENVKNKNTQQSYGWKFLKILGTTKGPRPKIESYELEETLIKILEDCFGTVRKKDGQDCECYSLRIMVTSTDLYLKEQGYIFQETDLLVENFSLD